MPGKAKSKIELIVESKVKDALRDLDRTDDKIDKLNKSGKKSSAIFSKAGKVMGGFIGAVALKEVAQYTLNLAKLGDAAKQVEEPFKKLVRAAGRDFTGALNDLRKAVRGTATDLELMQRSSAAMDAFTASGMNATEAFEATQQTMDFLYRYATKFGKNFNELMSTVFTGLQRGSALFLDDVGIMIDQTDAQFAGLDTIEKKSQIVRVALEQMAQKNELLGDVTEEANVKLKQAGVEYENLKVEIGRVLSEPVGEFFAGVTSVLKGLSSATKSATSRYSELRDETKKSESEITGLMDRYKELKANVKPTAEEQVELNTVIKRLADLVPGSISAIDDYGEALDINLGAVNRFVEGQQRLLRRTKADAFADMTSRLKNQINDLDLYTRELNTAQKQRQKFEEYETAGKKEIVFETTAYIDGAEQIIKTTTDVQKSLGTIDETISKNQNSIIDMQDELNGLVSELAIFYNLEEMAPEKLSSELKISTEQARDLIERFKELNELEDSGGKGGKGKKPKVDTSESDNKRLASLQLQMKLNQIALDDTKDKYQKMRDVVIARYESEIKAAKGKADIVSALRQIEKDELAKIDNKEKEELKQKEAEQTKTIQEIRNNIILEGMRNEFDIRLTEIQQYYDRELELAAGNADLIAALEEEKASRIKTVYDDLAQHIADTYFEQHEFQGALVDAASAGYDTFVRSMLDTQMSGAEKSQAIWNSMKQVFIGSLADMLKKYISNKMTELLIDTTLEKTKTSVRAGGAAARAVISGTEIANSAAVTSANTAEAASGYMEAHSNIPFVGYAIGAAFVVAMLAMLSNIGKKSKGGIITNSELFKGYVPEGEDGLIGVQAGEEVMTKKATAKYRPVLDAMNADQPLALPKMRLAEDGFSISSLAAPQPVRQIIQREYITERTIERVPVEGEIVVRTVAPDYAEVRDYHVKVNREVNRPDSMYVDRNLETEDNPF